MPDTIATLRILEPHRGVFAYYDGRIAGRRLHGAAPNWLDDAAYGLGIASYAIVDGEHALIYDTHITLDHARAVRSHLKAKGVKSIRVVLSHWHIDHIAGNEAFADCEIIALKETAEKLEANREVIAKRVPLVDPVIGPNKLFERRLNLQVGERLVELHHFNIHSSDGNLLWLSKERILLAGDTLEDTITYIAEPENLSAHIVELERLQTWPIEWILPNHGDPARLAAGGYGSNLIAANLRYLRALLTPGQIKELKAHSLKHFIENDTESSGVSYFEAYEAVHRKNLDSVEAALQTDLT